MERDQIRVGYDYWWNMPPRADGSPRRAVIRVTSEPRLEKVGKTGDRQDYVVDAVFLQREGAKEPTRYPVQTYFLQPVAYAQGLKKGDIVFWQRNRGNDFTPPLTVDGPRDEETGIVPVIWHHDRESRDGTKPAGDSRHDVPNRYLFRREAADVMRATQPSTPQMRTAVQTNTSRQATPPSDVAYATREDLDGVDADIKIMARAGLVALGVHTPKTPEEKALLVKHLSQMAGVEPS